MGWLSDKMKKWEKSVDCHAGCNMGCKVIQGWEVPGDDLHKLALWSEEAQERLGTLIKDSELRKTIMLDRSCVFSEEFGDSELVSLHRLYTETKSVPAVIDAMCKNEARFGTPYIEGDTIIEIRHPRDPEAFKVAKTPREKQIAACFCPLIRETEHTIDLEYCYCSAGWYKGIYEAVFGKPVTVKVDESFIHGDTRCKFTISLSSGK